MLSDHYRPLTLRARTDVTDAYNASVPYSWTDTDFTGYIEQDSRGENMADGRQAEVSQWLLMTDTATLTAQDRVVDGSDVYEVIGRPWAVYRGSVVHHYEATLRLVAG